MNVLTQAGGILFHILHGSRWVILCEKNILVTARRKHEVIEHNSRSAIGKSTDITVARLINTYRVTNVSMDAATMVKPLDNAISIIFGEKDVGGVRAGACHRKVIKRRCTRKFTGNIEAV